MFLHSFINTTLCSYIQGRLLPEYFPKIFGEKENEPISYEAAELKFLELQKTINDQLIASGSVDVTIRLFVL